MSRRKYRYLFLFSMILFLVGLISPVMCKSAEYLDICTEEGLQINPVAAWNTKQRKYLAVWYSQHDPAGIYGICLDPNGESLGDPTRISSVVNTSDKNHAPGISYDSDKDQYLISWHDSDPDKDQSKDIYAALVSIDEDRKSVV